MTVLCPKQTPKLSRLTASSQVLITARTRIITCVSRVLHVFTTCVTRGCPWAKFWAVQNFLPRPTPFRFFSASCHVYKSTVARLKLDINADNIVCFTGDNFLTGFGRDQAVKRCVTGPLHPHVALQIRCTQTGAMCCFLHGRTRQCFQNYMVVYPIGWTEMCPRKMGGLGRSIWALYTANRHRLGLHMYFWRHLKE